MSNIELIFLGTGAAIPPPGRQQVSFALIHHNGTIIFDCGEGTQYQVRKLKVPLRKDLVICISHLHSDHFLGLPGLFASLQLLNREKEVTIVGPRGINELITNLLLINFVKVSYPLRFVELESNSHYRAKGYKLHAIAAIHEARALSFTFRENERLGSVDIAKAKQLGVPTGPLLGKLQNNETITVDGKEIQPTQIIGPAKRGRVIAYSGDTAINPIFLESFKVCDLLVHEATYPSDMGELAAERGHTTIRQITDLFPKLNISQLVLTHFSQRFNEYEVEFTTYAIPDKIIIAQEGMKIVIPLIG